MLGLIRESTVVAIHIIYVHFAFLLIIQRSGDKKLWFIYRKYSFARVPLQIREYFIESQSNILESNFWAMRLFLDGESWLHIDHLDLLIDNKLLNGGLQVG